MQTQRKVLGDPDFVGTFIAPNMTWMEDYETLVNIGTLPKDSNLPSLVAKRLKWEIFENLGLRARRGRTLENTLSAAVSVDQNLLKEWANEILPHIRAKYEGLKFVTTQDLLQFLTGLLYRLRTSGGIVHPALKDYIQKFGKARLFIRHHWGPNFKPNRPRHGFLSTKSTQNFLPLTGTKNNSWVQGWGHKCMVQHLTPAGFDVALKDIIESAPSGILKQYPVNQHSVWGIEPGKLKVSTSVVRFACKTCAYDVSVPEQDAGIWHDMHCLEHRCSGRFKLQGGYDIDYYRALYGSGEVRRFVPREHTGLLTPEDREEIEKTFMQTDRHPWDPNIVSCTPTLELGIDIGDLSTVFLCSIPPSQANYVQRIGRAGRKDGNSFGFTVANDKPHDLYFFAKPEDMISEEVSVPGVFLQAPAVLERQMTAYSLDMWVAHNKNTTIPGNLRTILGSLPNEEKGKFPFNWLNYVEAHADELTQGFKELFGNLELLESIKHLFYPDPSSKTNLKYKVTEALIQKYTERQDLYNRIERLNRRIKDHENAPRDEHYERDLKDLRNHRAGLKHLRLNIGDKNVFNFLSDEGILPNYAFPQSSAELHSTILRRKEKTDQAPLIEIFKRPGQQAIREFAPGNYFYANGKKVQVSGIRFDKDDVQKWRFCPDCSWHEPEPVEQTDKCPQCQCDAWGDMGQVQRMIRLSVVRATSFESKSRIDDRQEEREPPTLIIRIHVKFDSKDVKIAYQSQQSKVPFGLEFIQGANFTFINHGKTSAGAQPMMIAGKEELIEGFNVCIDCGKVKLENQATPHEYYCRYRGKDKDDRTFLSLYHDFESESIRILLPVAEHTETTVQAESFSAALLMGLKTHFKGQVDHLKTISQDAPVRDEQIRRTFIYLYDTVPGGTGYLKDLLTDKVIIGDVLKPALKKLRECDCRHDDSKDGCYRCLFAYCNSFQRGSISRETAINILESIVNKGEGLEKIRSIEDIDIHPLVDSTLEEAFIYHLNEWKFATLVTRRTGVNKFYELTVGERTWAIQCQVLLDESKGVRIASQPDFLLTPDKGANSLPIAVFMDGFTYHRDRLADDTLKRMAILTSGRYLVWSLTWDDLKKADSGKMGDLFPLDSQRKGAGHFDNFIKKFETKLVDLSLQKNARTAGSFELLQNYLRDPNPDKWQAFAYCHSVLNIVETSSAEDISKTAPQWFIDDYFRRRGERTGAFWTRSKVETHSSCVAANLVHHGTDDPANLRVFVYIDDRAQSDISFKPFWNGFLRAMNLCQFLHPRTGFFCASGLQEDEHYEVLNVGESLPQMPYAWRLILNNEHIIPSCVPLLGSLADREAPAPEMYFEIINDDAGVLTTAEIAWPDQKVAFLYDECWDDRFECERNGWSCFELEKLTTDDVPAILRLLTA